MSPREYVKVTQNENERLESEFSFKEDLYSGRSSSPLLRSFSFLLALVAVFILGGIAILEYLDSREGGSPAPLLLQESFFPTFPKVVVNFSNGGEFTRYDSHGDRVWDELVPIGAGYLRVPNPKQYDLAPSWPIANDTEKSEIYQASVIHQLHCMATLREYIRTFESGEVPPHSKHLHVTHCIDYVRQAILCNADTTLEQGDASGFNGDGAVHQCRDWSVVKEFLIQKRASDDIPSILST